MGSKTRYLPLHPAAGGLIVDYLEADGRGLETTGALFRAIRGHAAGLGKAITADGGYKSFGGSQPSSGSRLVRMRCWRRRRPTRSTTRPTSPRLVCNIHTNDEQGSDP